jgi:hypothetical protein
MKLDNRAPVMHIKASFMIKGSGRLLNGTEYSARLYDKDLIKDDFIEVSSLSAEGEVAFTLHTKNIAGWDSPGETKPDLYIVLEKYGEEIFRTPVAVNLDIDKSGDFDPDKGIHFDLGTYLVDTE